MPYSSIVIKDGGNNDRNVKTRLVGVDHTQVLDLESVSSYLNLNLGATGVLVNAGVRLVHNWEIFNRDVVALYVKLYDKATAPSELDTPIRVWEILSGSPEPFSGERANGLEFALGFGLRCTTGFAHADTGAPAANGCIVNFGHRAG